MFGTYTETCITSEENEYPLKTPQEVATVKRLENSARYVFRFPGIAIKTENNIQYMCWTKVFCVVIVMRFGSNDYQAIFQLDITREHVLERHRRYMAEILPIRRKNHIQSINHI